MCLKKTKNVMGVNSGQSFEALWLAFKERERPVRDLINLDLKETELSSFLSGSYFCSWH